MDHEETLRLELSHIQVEVASNPGVLSRIIEIRWQLWELSHQPEDLEVAV